MPTKTRSKAAPKARSRTKAKAPTAAEIAAAEDAKNGEGVTQPKSAPDAISRVANKQMGEDEKARLQESATKLNGPAPTSKPKAQAKGKGKAKGGKRGRGFLDCAIEVLRKASGPMTTKEITAAVLDNKMTTTTGGKTPVAAMYVQLHQAAHKRKPPVTVQAGPSLWDLHELNPRGAAKRPTKKASK